MLGHPRPVRRTSLANQQRPAAIHRRQHNQRRQQLDGQVPQQKLGHQRRHKNEPQCRPDSAPSRISFACCDLSHPVVSDELILALHLRDSRTRIKD